MVFKSNDSVLVTIFYQTVISSYFCLVYSTSTSALHHSCLQTVLLHKNKHTKKSWAYNFNMTVSHKHAKLLLPVTNKTQSSKPSYDKQITYTFNNEKSRNAARNIWARIISGICKSSARGTATTKTMSLFGMAVGEIQLKDKIYI